MIPDSVTEIGYSVFKECPDVTIVCREDSCAKEYCLKEELNFSIDD